jgi:hypothetical protein
MLTEGELTLITTILTLDRCIVDYIDKHPEAAQDESLLMAIQLVGAMLDDISPEERELIDLYFMKLAVDVLKDMDDE